LATITNKCSRPQEAYWRLNAECANADWIKQYLLHAAIIDNSIGVFSEVIYKLLDESNPVDTGQICSAREVKARVK
jgi:hypothetical protein